MIDLFWRVHSLSRASHHFVENKGHNYALFLCSAWGAGVAVQSPVCLHWLSLEHVTQDEGQQPCVPAQQQLHEYLKQEVQINLSSWNYRGNLGRQNAISQDTEVNTVNLVESAMGPLITATGQGLSFMSHPKDGTSQCLVVLLWLEEGNSATYCNSIISQHLGLPEKRHPHPGLSEKIEC